MNSRRGHWLALGLSVLALALSLTHRSDAEEPEDPTGHLKLIRDASRDLFVTTADAMKNAERTDWAPADIERVRELLVLVKLISGEANVHYHE
jgi:hypothetical protein